MRFDPRVRLVSPAQSEVASLKQPMGPMPMSTAAKVVMPQALSWSHRAFQPHWLMSTVWACKLVSSQLSLSTVPKTKLLDIVSAVSPASVDTAPATKVTSAGPNACS
eukprot:COSAG04_NODE_3900_length_2438_cov_1.339034_3_plen_107_part_00